MNALWSQGGRAALAACFRHEPEQSVGRRRQVVDLDPERRERVVCEHAAPAGAPAAEVKALKARESQIAAKNQKSYAARIYKSWLDARCGKTREFHTAL